jgi:hypothetical protein
MLADGARARSPLPRQLAAATGVAFAVSWLATGGLFVWGMRLDHVPLREFPAYWQRISSRAKSPTVSQVAAVDIATTVLWLFSMAARSFQKQRIEKEAMMGFCVRCGYDLFSNPSGICPECGTPIRNYESTDTRRPRMAVAHDLTARRCRKDVIASTSGRSVTKE